MEILLNSVREEKREEIALDNTIPGLLPALSFGIVIQFIIPDVLLVSHGKDRINTKAS
jgi:hypothetical protein